MKTLVVSEYLSASAVMAAGAELLEVTAPGPGNRCGIVFDDSSGQASEALAQHKARNLTVNSHRFVTAFLAVKRGIFEARG